MSTNSIDQAAAKPAVKPTKPFPWWKGKEPFPLSPHASGKWCKKIRGRLVYFGAWAVRKDAKLVAVDGDGWEEALKLYHQYTRGETKGEVVTLGRGCNRFLASKALKVESREIGPRTLADYREITDLLTNTFGPTKPIQSLDAEDFGTLRATMSKRWGLTRLTNGIIRVKCVFNYILKEFKVEPKSYGGDFDIPTKEARRRNRNGGKMFAAADIRKLLDDASPSMRAAILLGSNAGLGNNDVACLAFENKDGKPTIDMATGMLDYPRPKNGSQRQAWLWPETIEAIKAVIEQRPKPKSKEDSQIVFLMPSGRRWVRLTEKSRTDNVSMAFLTLLRKLGLHREGLNFYSLRRTFRTVADEARDTVAADLIMGHTDPSMAAIYRQLVDDGRVRRVCSYVRDWLFKEKPVTVEEFDISEMGPGE